MDSGESEVEEKVGEEKEEGEGEEVGVELAGQGKRRS